MKKTGLVLWLVIVAVVLAMLYYTPGTATVSTATNVEQPSANAAAAAALSADQARLAAMMAGDGKALAALMSDELRFVHSDGRIETKESYVKNLLAGDTAYADAKTAD